MPNPYKDMPAHSSTAGEWVYMTTGAGSSLYQGSGSWQAGHLPRKNEWVYVTFMQGGATISYIDQNGTTVNPSLASDFLPSSPLAVRAIQGSADGDFQYYIM